MSVEKLGWIVLIPLVVMAILFYLNLPRGVALFCLAVTLAIVARLLFAKRL